MGDAIKALPDKLTPWVDFEIIKTNVDKNIDFSIFNGREDLQAMVDFSIGIDRGYMDDKYLKKQPPAISNAR